MKKVKFAILIVIVLCTSCVGFFEKPGEGNTAIYGFKSMYIIQDEIYKYRLKNNVFPQDLTFLNKIDIPIDYSLMDDSAIQLKDMKGKTCRLKYRNYNNEYFELEYTYTPPGMNRMKYDSINRKWMISGHY